MTSTLASMRVFLTLWTLVWLLQGCTSQTLDLLLEVASVILMFVAGGAVIIVIVVLAEYRCPKCKRFIAIEHTGAKRKNKEEVRCRYCDYLAWPVIDSGKGGSSSTGGDGDGGD